MHNYIRENIDGNAHYLIFAHTPPNLVIFEKLSMLYKYTEVVSHKYNAVFQTNIDKTLLIKHMNDASNPVIAYIIKMDDISMLENEMPIANESFTHFFKKFKLLRDYVGLN